MPRSYVWVSVTPYIDVVKNSQPSPHNSANTTRAHLYHFLRDTL